MLSLKLYLAKKLARFMSDCRVLLLLTAGSLSRTSSVRPASDPSLSVSSQFLRKTPLNIFETPFEILLIAPSVVSFKHPIDQNIFQKQMWMKKISINEKTQSNFFFNELVTCEPLVFYDTVCHTVSPLWQLLRALIFSSQPAKKLQQYEALSRWLS